MSRRLWQNPRIPRCVPLWFSVVFCGVFLPGPEAWPGPSQSQGVPVRTQGRGGALARPLQDPCQTKWVGATQAPGPHLPPHQAADVSTATVSTATVSMATVATATPSCLPFPHEAFPFFLSVALCLRPDLLPPTSPSLQLMSKPEKGGFDWSRQQHVVQAAQAGRSGILHCATVTGPPGDWQIRAAVARVAGSRGTVGCVTGGQWAPSACRCRKALPSPHSVIPGTRGPWGEQPLATL